MVDLEQPRAEVCVDEHIVPQQLEAATATLLIFFLLLRLLLLLVLVLVLYPSLLPCIRPC